MKNKYKFKLANKRKRRISKCENQNHDAFR